MCERYTERLPLAHPNGTWPATQACALAGNQTSPLLVHTLALVPLNHTSQGHSLASIVLSSTFVCQEMLFSPRLV